MKEEIRHDRVEAVVGLRLEPGENILSRSAHGPADLGEAAHGGIADRRIEVHDHCIDAMAKPSALGHARQEATRAAPQLRDAPWAAAAHCRAERAGIAHECVHQDEVAP